MCENQENILNNTKEASTSNEGHNESPLEHKSNTSQNTCLTCPPVCSISNTKVLKSEEKFNQAAAKLMLESEIEIMQRRIKKNEKLESKKQKTFTRLTPSPELTAYSSEKDVVGDDLNTKEEVHILCECQPTVSGGAVPKISSFTLSQPGNKTPDEINSNDTLNTVRIPSSITDNILKPSTNSSKELINRIAINEVNQSLKDVIPSKSVKDRVFLIDSAINRQGGKQKKNLDTNKINADRFPKRPSMIPKLTRPTSSGNNGNNKDHGKDQKVDDHESIGKSSGNTHNIKHSKLPLLADHVRIKAVDSNPVLEGDPILPEKISSRILCQEESLRATTSFIRHKFEAENNRYQITPTTPRQNNDRLSCQDKDNSTITTLKNKKNIEDLYRHIIQLKEIVSCISQNSTVQNKDLIDTLLRNITEIKNVAEKLRSYDTDCKKLALREKTEDIKKCDNFRSAKVKDAKSFTKSKDNKIYIKFIPTKDKFPEPKKKRNDESPEEHEVKSDLISSSKSVSELSCSNTNLSRKINESDSLDGIFIPTIEPPINIEDEEESNGLDITITFPEISGQMLSENIKSHLSVCLSDISEEALNKLKRCPKEFTLRMDFIQGKVLFQSGKGPSNNFVIGPDLKFMENSIDDKESADFISIKPSTECSYASQIIPVESVKDRTSLKSLKSTDSELFNVVNLPFLFTNSSANYTTKSCITLKNNKFLSMAILARQYFKSMPQIPSLTNIFEDHIMEHFTKSAFQIQEKRRRNRQNQKKRINSSTCL